MKVPLGKMILEQGGETVNSADVQKNVPDRSNSKCKERPEAGAVLMIQE